MHVSVVIPALNEAGNIGRLVEETYAVVPADLLAEVVVVDDCSTDQTASEIKTLIARETLQGLRYLRHGIRCGQSAAVRTGIFAAASPVIATMDGDGQTDPRDIVRLLERLAPPGGQGPALVGGIRTERKAEGSKRLASRAANWIRDRVLDDDCPDTGCGIKTFWREAFLRLPYFSGVHRYLPALFLTYGYEVAYLPGTIGPVFRPVQVQQSWPRSARPARSGGCELAAQAYQGAGHRRGPAGRPSGVRSGEPFQPARGCGATRRRQDLSARASSHHLGAAGLAMDRRLQFSPCTRVCVSSDARNTYHSHATRAKPKHPAARFGFYARRKPHDQTKARDVPAPRREPERLSLTAHLQRAHMYRGN